MRSSVIVLALLLVVATARPAQAGTGLSLSLDGKRWSDSIEGELFDSTDTWVPGDEATVTFWVRNDSGSPADLRIDVLDSRGTLRLGRDVLLSTEVDGRRSPVGEHLAAESGLDGAPRRVDLTALMPVTTGNAAQQRFLTLRLRVTLIGQLTPTLPGASTPTSSEATSDLSARLSATGSPAGLLVAALGGLLLVGVGGLLATRRRRC
jgi:hypothetical protein